MRDYLDKHTCGFVALTMYAIGRVSRLEIINVLDIGLVSGPANQIRNFQRPMCAESKVLWKQSALPSLG